MSKLEPLRGSPGSAQESRNSGIGSLSRRAVISPYAYLIALSQTDTSEQGEDRRWSSDVVKKRFGGVQLGPAPQHDHAEAAAA